MSERRSPELMEMQRIEAERSEMKRTTERLLREAFTGILSEEELEHRLKAVADTVFVNEQDFDRLLEEHPDEADAAGVMRVEVKDGKIRRYAVVKQATRAEQLHSLAHETTHLMAPDSYFVTKIWQDDDADKTYSVYIGPLRHERFVENGKVDPLSMELADRKPRQRILFWEAVTDWHADELLRNELTDEEKEEIETTGYLERQYISYLIDQSPDREELIKAIRTTYAEGNEDPFRWALHKITDRKDDQMYEALLDVLKIPLEQWEERVDLWMGVVQKYFSTKSK